jgi:hypothetical protein
VTTIRIAHAEPRPGRLANGGFHTRGHLVVLADDAGHRAVPIWIQGAGDLADLLERPADQVITDSVPQELTTRLLGAARTRVTGVDIDVTEAGVAELSPEVTVARIGLAGPAGTRQVTADLGLGLALAAAAGAPVRLADAVLDRLAIPVPGDDLLTSFLDRVPPAAWPWPGHAPPRSWPRLGWLNFACSRYVVAREYRPPVGGRRSAVQDSTTPSGYWVRVGRVRDMRPARRLRSAARHGFPRAACAPARLPGRSASGCRRPGTRASAAPHSRRHVRLPSEYGRSTRRMSAVA